MDRNQFIMGAALGIATLSLILPSTRVLADEPQSSSIQAKELARQINPVSDVMLAPDGSLSGRVVDHSGLVQANVPVTIHALDKKLGETLTDDAGMFSFKGLPGGIYQIASGKTAGVFRVWTEKTAPPVAREQALLILGANGTRGQFAAIGAAKVALVAGVGTATGLSAAALSRTNGLVAAKTTAASVVRTSPAAVRASPAAVRASPAAVTNSLRTQEPLIRELPSMPIRQPVPQSP